MDLISLLIFLVVIGFGAWLIVQIPMAEPIRRIVMGVLCLFVVLWVLQQLGIVSSVPLHLRHG